MALTFSELQTEVKHRATKDQSGTEFNTAIKTAINSSIFRIARESKWKPLRRQASFTTVPELTSGTVSATNDSASFTGSSLNLITNGVIPGRRISIQGSSQNFIIQTITGENAFTTDRKYDGTTASGLTHTIYGQEEYNLPIQTGRIAFLWHEQYGYPYRMEYVPSMGFFDAGVDFETTDVPTYYKEWGQNNVIAQPLEASAISLSSSSSTDTSKAITVFGTVSGYPDYEIINTNSSNGTTAASGSKSFTSIERIVKDSSTIGRITLTANSANVTVAVLPVGNSTGNIEYRKIQIWPLPADEFPIHVWYYKDPWRLVNDGDIHELGQDFDEAIILLATSKIAMNSDKKESKSIFGLYSNELISLRKKNVDKLDYTPSLKRPRDSRKASGVHPNLSYQQLGGAYGPRFYT